MHRLKSLALLLFLVYLDPSESVSCTVEKNGQAGECKFITDCPAVLMAYQKLKEKPTICDNRTRQVCCPISRTTTRPVTISATTPEPPRRVSERKCRQYGEFIYETVTIQNPVFGEPPIVKRISTCSHEAVELIVGGTVAKEREFPHMALIGFGEGRLQDYQCGGSVISEQWILTAAHCTSTAGKTANWAKVGRVYRFFDTPNTWTHPIVERIQHPNYNSQFADDDIALFKVKDVIFFNKYVIPICLPDQAQLTTARAIATGWGRTGFGEDVSEALMKVTIEYFDRRVCDESFEDHDRLRKEQIDWNKMLCAGSTNKSGDTCNGDSGGPLQIYHTGVDCMYKIVGITSFGHVYCGYPGVPAIYTRVHHYLSWIESIVWPNQ